MTLEGLPDLLAAKGMTFRPTMPRFHRTALSWILNNRIYMGELVSKGKTYPSKLMPLVTRELFQRCQNILSGRNRRTGKPVIPLGGGSFRCARCGAAMTGELIKKALAGGAVREHLYYRCANHHPDTDHPKVRWRADDLDTAIIQDLETLRETNPKTALWMRDMLGEAFADVEGTRVSQQRQLAKQQSDLTGKLDRLLNAYLEGLIDAHSWGSPNNPGCPRNDGFEGVE